MFETAVVVIGLGFLLVILAGAVYTVVVGLSAAIYESAHARSVRSGPTGRASLHH